jgi:hypothetical protein
MKTRPLPGMNAQAWRAHNRASANYLLKERAMRSIQRGCLLAPRSILCTPIVTYQGKLTPQPILAVAGL